MTQRAVVLWIERAVDGTAAGHHLRGTLARLGAVPGLQISNVICDQHTSDGSESALHKMRRIASLSMKAMLLARPGRLLFARHHPLLLPTVLVWKLLRGVVILSVQGSLDALGNEYGRLGKSSTIRWISRLSARRADLLIAGAPVLLEHIRKELARPEQPVIPIANGVFVDELAAAGEKERPCDKPYVVFVGNLASWQGIGVMVDATRSAHWPSGVPLVVVGDGVERGRVAQQDNVVWLGRRPAAEAARWYAHAVCAISMQVQNGAVGSHGYWPFKLIESAAVGVPIVCSDARGMAEAAEKLGNAVVVPSGDSARCAEAVRELVEDPVRREALAQRGRSRVKEFDWAAASGEMVAAIKTAYEVADLGRRRVGG